VSEVYTNNYVIVAIFLILGILLPVATVSIIGPLLRPRKPTPEKQTTYESGNIPVGASTSSTTFSPCCLSFLM